MKKMNFIVKSCIMLLSALTIFSCSGSSQQAEGILFYVGSSGNQEHSIFLCELDAELQKFVVLDSFSGAAGASYLAPSPDFKVLYAINQEISDPEQQHASVSSFAVDSETPGLNIINSQSSEGRGICHIHCSQDGKYIFAANYSSGHASVLPVGENGQIGVATGVAIGGGSGPVGNRQEGPHAHQVMLDPSQRFLLVPDLGTDKVMIYSFDPQEGRLSPNPNQTFFKLAPGAGPRHLAFHPDGKNLYVVNELNSTISACLWDPAEGKLTEINTESTVGESHEGMKYPAAVRVHPSGNFVYASTRGENSCITTFRINADGSISRIQVMEQVPSWPRDFNVDPSGRYLISAGERSNDIRLYAIDQDSGLLSETDASLELPAPCCIVYIQ
jgi:6-phosphogluconolactonase